MADLKLLSDLGLNLTSEIEGLVCTKLEETKRPKVFVATMVSDDGSISKKAYVGLKSLDEGLIARDEKGVARIVKGFETYKNANENNSTWVRNKANVMAKLDAI